VPCSLAHATVCRAIVSYMLKCSLALATVCRAIVSYMLKCSLAHATVCRASVSYMLKCSLAQRLLPQVEDERNLLAAQLEKALQHSAQQVDQLEQDSQRLLKGLSFSSIWCWWC
jgi:hypothetical protein